MIQDEVTAAPHEEACKPECSGSSPDGPDDQRKVRRVLIVDDDDQVLGLIERWVRQAGLDPITCRTFEAARECLAQDSPEVLLTDIRLDGMNGLYLVLLAQRLPNLSSIVMTAFDDPGLHREAEQLNARYLVKPMTRDELLAAIVSEH